MNEDRVPTVKVTLILRIEVTDEENHEAHTSWDHSTSQLYEGQPRLDNKMGSAEAPI